MDTAIQVNADPDPVKILHLKENPIFFCMKDALLDSDPDPADQNQSGSMQINADPRGSGSKTKSASSSEGRGPTRTIGPARKERPWWSPRRRRLVYRKPALWNRSRNRNFLTSGTGTVTVTC
jgi:hypothetical protein